MAVETATTINQLDATKPGSSDPKSEGDDHIRLLKSTIKATFPNITGAVTPSHADLNVIAGAAAGAVSGFNVATQPASTNNTLAASTAMVQAAILASSGIAASLPAQAGNSGKFLTTNGSTASWGDAGSLVRSARTSNTVLGTADKSTLIDITSGTFTQTFDAAATLGNGWYCYIRNSGTGDITLDPNASETIDGLTSFIMYPGEVRLVQCDGTAFRSVVLNAFSRTFTATATFTKPPGYTAFEGLLWAGGGGGGRTGSISFNGGGGGGGACLPFVLPESQVPSSLTVTIGAGGLGATTAASGSAGGNSTFGSLATSYGGAGGGGNSGADWTGGGGGGLLGAGGAAGGSSVADGAGGAPTYNPSGGTHAIAGGVGFGGGSGGSQANAKNSIYGGAGGGGPTGTGVGGASLFGGGGGGGGGSTNAGGTSVYGGAGGAGAGSGVNGSPGAAPGGGGGGCTNGASAGNGARGELRIWGII